MFHVHTPPMGRPINDLRKRTRLWALRSAHSSDWRILSPLCHLYSGKGGFGQPASRFVWCWFGSSATKRLCALHWFPDQNLEEFVCYSFKMENKQVSSGTIPPPPTKKSNKSTIRTRFQANEARKDEVPDPVGPSSKPQATLQAPFTHNWPTWIYNENLGNMKSTCEGYVNPLNNSVNMLEPDLFRMFAAIDDPLARLSLMKNLKSHVEDRKIILEK